ncbi:hypothetical protein [Allorhizocola rhizosphaerae]|uniref:hypothetical protein n=1 Tax=Allorhizocola rhizosphaerae TaxID=1872709 RepID=UPI0013C31953|nr:hypothetical protein [Allorhizocola rhizosphaerae]
MTSSPVGRRSLLLGTLGVAATTVVPFEAHAAAPPLSRAGTLGELPVPRALRSRQALLAGRATARSTLPITQHGTTYNLAQVVRWLDSDHFAVGRWDGTMSIFSFQTAPFVGPLVTEVVNTPSSQGVQMITRLPGGCLVTSNDSGSILLWCTGTGQWSDLRLKTVVPYDNTLGVATSGSWFNTGSVSTLVVGHDSGFISLWSFHPTKRTLTLLRAVDLRNPNPVNPFGSHVMYGMCPLVASGANAIVVCGSDDGFVSLVRVPSGAVLSQTVFNPAAQRGINSVSALGNRLLVANCSVGADDENLWYFSIDTATWALTLLDSMNLIIDPTEIQSFNFDTKWAQYSGGPCWFAGTEEGALWMGTAGTSLNLIGNQPLFDGAIGAALDYTTDPGRLVAVIHNLHQFTTGA